MSNSIKLLKQKFNLTLKEQIRGLEIVMEDKQHKNDIFVSREYVLEKLKKIREGIPFIHLKIVEALMYEKRQKNTEKTREKRRIARLDKN